MWRHVSIYDGMGLVWDFGFHFKFIKAFDNVYLFPYYLYMELVKRHMDMT